MGNLHGGCLCGAVRFKATARPVFTEFCHCGTCRKATGAPVMAWAGIQANAFEFTAGALTDFASSPGVSRKFCGACGTSLSIHIQDFPEEIYVSVSAFDDPETVRPEAHIWTSEQPQWVKMADDLPRYRKFKADEVS